MDYHQLLKSEQEIKEEQNKQTTEKVNEQILIEQRNKWLKLTETQLYLNQLEVQLFNLYLDTVGGAENPSVDNVTLRLKLVEQQTIRKILNLLKYGRYTS